MPARVDIGPWRARAQVGALVLTGIAVLGTPPPRIVGWRVLRDGTRTVGCAEVTVWSAERSYPAFLLRVTPSDATACRFAVDTAELRLGARRFGAGPRLRTRLDADTPLAELELHFPDAAEWDGAEGVTGTLILNMRADGAELGRTWEVPLGRLASEGHDFSGRRWVPAAGRSPDVPP